MRLILISGLPQDADAIVDPLEPCIIPKGQAVKQAQDAFQLVLQHGPKIELDHHIVYHTRKILYGFLFFIPLDESQRYQITNLDGYSRAKENMTAQEFSLNL